TTQQFRIPNGVARTFGVLTAIGLHDQLGRVAGEVGDIRSDGNLTAEFVIDKAPVAEELPELAFSFGGLAAHGSRQFPQSRIGALLAPLIRPSGTFSHEGR